MAKQDKSKFQLNKGTDYRFDKSKRSKRKFDLTKDTDLEVTETELRRKLRIKKTLNKKRTPQKN